MAFQDFIKQGAQKIFNLQPQEDREVISREEAEKSGLFANAIHLGGKLPEWLKGKVQEVKERIKTNEIKPEQEIIHESVTPKENPLPPIRTRSDHISGYNFRGYSTREEHINEVRDIYGATPNFTDFQSIQNEIDRVMKVKNQTKPPQSPITGEMVLNASERYGVSPRLMMAIMRKETGLGLEGKGAKYNNPGNINISDTGRIQKYPTWEEGVNAVARELSRRLIGREQENNLTENIQ